jgi:hypothetical protein
MSARKREEEEEYERQGRRGCKTTRLVKKKRGS